MVSYQELYNALYTDLRQTARSIDIKDKNERILFSAVREGATNVNTLMSALDIYERGRDGTTDMMIVRELMSLYAQQLLPQYVDRFSSMSGSKGCFFRDAYLDYGNLDPIYINIDRWIEFAEKSACGRRQLPLFSNIKALFDNYKS